MTPAQAYGHPNFVDDVPVQGPTDPGIRAADCWYRNNVLPKHPACVDCKGPIPMWAQHSRAGLSERISFGGVGARGFALGAAGDPDIWAPLTNDQKTWVINVLTGLNNRIYQSTNTTCPTWAAPTMGSISGAVGCFQAWFNSVQTAGAPVTKLRTDGVFDQDTLNALIATQQIHSADFPATYPGTAPAPSTTATPTASVTTTTSGMSTGKMVGIAALGALGIGGIALAVSHGGKKSRRRRRSR